MMPLCLNSLFWKHSESAGFDANKGRISGKLNNFDYKKNTLYSEDKVKRFYWTSGIIHNKLSNSAVSNAQALWKSRKNSAVSNYIWAFTNGTPIINDPKALIKYLPLYFLTPVQRFKKAWF
jgi:3-methyladenine DNA glycosylase Tag